MVDALEMASLFSKKVNLELHYPAIPIFSRLKRTENICSYKKLYSNIHSSINLKNTIETI